MQVNIDYVDNMAELWDARKAAEQIAFRTDGWTISDDEMFG